MCGSDGDPACKDNCSGDAVFNLASLPCAGPRSGARARAAARAGPRPRRLCLAADDVALRRHDVHARGPHAAAGRRRGRRRRASAAAARAPRRALRGRSARAASPRRTVRGELARMLAAGAIDQATHDARRAIYGEARRLRAKLSGARRAALGAVLRNLEDVAASGGLTASRLPALFRDRRAQPPVVVERAAAAPRRARELLGQPDRVAVLRGRGPADPVAGHVRQGQRPVAGRLRRVAARAARRGAGARRRARRRDRLGVPLSLRRRPPAVGQRPRAGHRRCRRSRARPCASASRATSRRRAPAWGSSARRRPAACGWRRRPARTTSSTPSHRACGCSTRSRRRSTACTTSPCWPTTPRAARCSPPARRSCAASSPHTTPAAGRATRSAAATPT